MQVSCLRRKDQNTKAITSFYSTRPIFHGKRIPMQVALESCFHTAHVPRRTRCRHARTPQVVTSLTDASPRPFLVLLELLLPQLTHSGTRPTCPVPAVLPGRKGPNFSSFWVILLAGLSSQENLHGGVMSQSPSPKLILPNGARTKSFSFLLC